MAAAAPRGGGPGSKGGSKDGRVALPEEWKIELPKQGAVDTEFGGCRSIEAGYERGPVLGQGTYGEVYLAWEKGRRNDDRGRVAAKKIKMDNEKEGFPITAIREIKILSALREAEDEINGQYLRNNVITLREIVRSGSHTSNNYKGSIYMIFDYMDHDMTGLLERTTKHGPKFTASQIKCYLRQLFFGLALLHAKELLHRDLKNANLLVNNQGVLKIADFGLARYSKKRNEAADGAAKVDSRMTNRVITLWYRPPELFLGADHYGPEIDMWSAGCIMYELLTGKPLFPGKDETDQLEKIFYVMGRPTEETMPGCTSLPNYGIVNMARFPLHCGLRRHLEQRIPDKGAVDMLEELLRLDPKNRLGAAAAATHTYFSKAPLPARPEDMPHYPPSHEMGMKRMRHEGGGHQGQAPPAQRQRRDAQYTGGAPQQQQPQHRGPAGGAQQQQQQQQQTYPRGRGAPPAAPAGPPPPVPAAALAAGGVVYMSQQQAVMMQQAAAAATMRGYGGAPVPAGVFAQQASYLQQQQQRGAYPPAAHPRPPAPGYQQGQPRPPAGPPAGGVPSWQGSRR